MHLQRVKSGPKAAPARNEDDPHPAGLTRGFFLGRRVFMGTTARILTALILMSIIDTVTPLPVLGAVLMYVVLKKPVWFRVYVGEIYGDS